MKIKLSDKRTTQAAVVLPLFENKGLTKHSLLKGFSKMDLVYLEKIVSKVDLGDAQSRLIYLPSDPNISVFIMGLGKETMWQVRLMVTVVRKIITLARENRVSSLTVS